ncbi:Tigger transposable element-derived protein 4, partial [Trichinella zimbabwensis]
LPILLRGYESRNIFSVVESGLFYKALPNHMLAVKGSSVCGGKAVKDRWTVVLFRNMGSAEKHVYEIGKSRKPRYFCNKKLPLPYYSNIKSWITSSICIDSINSTIVLHNIEMRFLPTNTCCVTQPLDQCVIRSFKAYYRACMVRKQLLIIEQGKSVIEFANTVTVVSAMLMIKQAWESVTEVTIRNCFRKAHNMTNQMLNQITRLYSHQKFLSPI